MVSLGKWSTTSGFSWMDTPSMLVYPWVHHVLLEAVNWTLSIFRGLLIAQSISHGWRTSFGLPIEVWMIWSGDLEGCWTVVCSWFPVDLAWCGHGMPWFFHDVLGGCWAHCFGKLCGWKSGCYWLMWCSLVHRFWEWLGMMANSPFGMIATLTR